VKTEDDFKLLLVDSGVVINNLDDDELGAHRIWKRINNQCKFISHGSQRSYIQQTVEEEAEVLHHI
jgi:hypothetical protein